VRITSPGNYPAINVRRGSGGLLREGGGSWTVWGSLCQDASNKPGKLHLKYGGEGIRWGSVVEKAESHTQKGDSEENTKEYFRVEDQPSRSARDTNVNKDVQ